MAGATPYSLHPSTPGSTPASCGDAAPMGAGAARRTGCRGRRSGQQASSTLTLTHPGAQPENRQGGAVRPTNGATPAPRV